MPNERLKVFLDTNVILEALRGTRGARALFKSESEEVASYVVSPVVVQELIFAAGDAESKTVLDELIQHVKVFSSEVPVSPEFVADILRARNQLVHANDVLILGEARGCDFFLTYDQQLLSLGDAIGVVARTPEAFLAEFGVEP